MSMSFDYRLVLERDGEYLALFPEVSFEKCGNSYGNGYHMSVHGCSLEPFHVFDCRYDDRLNDNTVSDYFEVFAREKWTGKNGSATLVSVKKE